MRDGLLIYGANGYTGRLIARTFARAGLKPLLAGRDADKVRAVADELALSWTSFDLSDQTAVDAALSKVVVVLHCAGPFWVTSTPMVDACIRTGTHYLDITGEIDVFEACAARKGEAGTAGIMLLPGCGFDVVPSDCLAAHVFRRQPDATHLRISISVPGAVSPGTLTTVASQVARMTRVRRDGTIVDLDVPPKRQVDFGKGPRTVAGVSWGDVSTAFHSLHVPNIEVEFELTPQMAQLANLPAALRNWLGTALGQRVLQAYARSIRATPDAEGSPDWSCTLLAEATNAGGSSALSRLRTKGAYWVTAQTTLAIARRVLGGDAPVGYQTPSSAYGGDLILEVPGSTLEDIDVY